MSLCIASDSDSEAMPINVTLALCMEYLMLTDYWIVNASFEEVRSHENFSESIGGEPGSADCGKKP